MTVRPFKIEVAQAVLDDLHERLEMTHRGRVAASRGWDYGTDPDYLTELLHYWRHTFDWRAREASLNAFAQFTAEIDGARLHFIHERTDAVRAVPLLLLHGWPDSFVRYLKVLPLLKRAALIHRHRGLRCRRAFAARICVYRSRRKAGCDSPGAAYGAAPAETHDGGTRL